MGGAHAAGQAFMTGGRRRALGAAEGVAAAVVESRPDLIVMRAGLAQDEFLAANSTVPMVQVGSIDLALPRRSINLTCIDTLMGGANTLAILHNGDVYTLRKTRYGKLILTK